MMAYTFEAVHTHRYLSHNLMTMVCIMYIVTSCVRVEVLHII